MITQSYATRNEVPLKPLKGGFLSSILWKRTSVIFALISMSPMIWLGVGCASGGKSKGKKLEEPIATGTSITQEEIQTPTKQPTQQETIESRFDQIFLLAKRKKWESAAALAGELYDEIQSEVINGLRLEEDPDWKNIRRLSIWIQTEKEIEEIFDLSKKKLWVQAEEKAEALSIKTKQAIEEGYLSAESTEAESVDRVYAWIKAEKERRLERAIEDQIRNASSINSRTDPTWDSIFQDKGKPGLPPRSDVRDAVEQIESTPYVPQSYGKTKTIERAGDMNDPEKAKGKMAGLLEETVSLTLADVSLEKVLYAIMEQKEGFSFVADKTIPAFEKKISINLESAKLREVLIFVSRNYGVHFQIGEDLVWILDGQDPKSKFGETRFYKLKQGFLMPAQFGATDINRTTVNNKGVITITEVEKVERFVQDGAPVLPALDAAIQRFYEGEFMIDYERNLIVARSTIDQLDLLERIIDEFDRPVQQVLISARFITVSEAAFLELGATWETGRGQLQNQRSPIDFTGLATPNLGLGLQESFFNVLSRQDLSITMTALEQSGESQTISAPSLILVNNRPGTISDGKLQYYYEEYTVKQSAFERGTTADLVPQGKPTKINSGVELNVLASIGGDGKSIMLALNPSVSQDVKFVTFATVSSRDGSGNVVSTFDIILPESRNQDLSTRVVVNSGQTVVMGGVTQREQSTFVESVPLLGNLPLIGAAFRKRTEIDRPRYLLIFVTASLVSQSGEFLEYVDASQLPPTLDDLQQALAVPPLQTDVSPTLIEPKPIEPDLTRQE